MVVPQRRHDGFTRQTVCGQNDRKMRKIRRAANIRPKLQKDFNKALKIRCKFGRNAKTDVKRNKGINRKTSEIAAGGQRGDTDAVEKPVEKR